MEFCSVSALNRTMSFEMTNLSIIIPPTINMARSADVYYVVKPAGKAEF